MTDFLALSAALARAGLDRPALVLDQAALSANLTHLDAALPKGLARRVADKSLAAPDLMAAALAGLRTDRVMSFDLRLTARVLARFPQAQVLMGKPMPVSQAAVFRRDCAHADRVIWLIDSPARAADYAALNVAAAFEVDIGLGRGGFADPRAVRDVVALQGLRPAGVMGYEPHVAALPRALGGGTGGAAQARAMARLADFAAVLPAGNIVNSCGSTTALALPPGTAATEVTTGSAVVKPADFDQPCNAGLRPALFIATPILKCVVHGLPGHPRLSARMRAARLIRDRVAFTFGGKWMAQPVWPSGLRISPFYGTSANQQGWTMPRGLPAPDRIILRPTQSEAVIQQFSEIALFDGGEITGFWPVWPPC